MADKCEQYAKKLAHYYAEGREQRKDSTGSKNEITISGLWSKQMEVTQNFTRDFTASVGPKKGGLKGKVIVLIKRFFRKGTKNILDQLVDRIRIFQSKSMELSGQIIQFLAALDGRMQQSSVQVQQAEEQARLATEQAQQAAEQARQAAEQAQQASEQARQATEQAQQAGTDIENLKEQVAKQQSTICSMEKDLRVCVSRIQNAQLTETLEHDEKKRIDMMFSGRNTGFPSYSQCGEDGILNYLLFTIFRTEPSSIRYLDIGCNDYKDDNNTYFFYLTGASGVEIDANPDCAENVSKNRCRDTVLNVGVAPDNSEPLTFYVMSNYGLSTFSKESVEDALRKNPENKVEREIKVPVLGINTILQKYFSDKAPDILSVDTEGTDAAILNAMDFDRYRPKLVIVETIDYAPWVVIEQRRQDILDIMKAKGYVEFAFTGINSIFIDPAMLR